MSFSFEYDSRLNLEVPRQEQDWDEIPEHERRGILEQWENIRGQIPGRIVEFEQEIEERQERMQAEEDWDACLALMDEISDFASRINDLNILFRSQPDAVWEGATEKSDPPDRADASADGQDAGERANGLEKGSGPRTSGRP